MKIIDIALKDLLRSFRSVIAIGLMLVVPLLITGLIYFAFGGLSAGTGRLNLPALGLVLVNGDTPDAGGPALGQLLIDYFNDPAMPEWLAVSTAATEAEARAAVRDQAAGVAVIIPPGFSQAVLSLDSVTGGRIAATVVGDQLAAQGLAVDQAAVLSAGQAYGVWVADAERNLHHSDTPSLTVRAPAAGEAAAQPSELARILATIMAGMLIFFVFFGGANTAESILREDEEGTLARLFTTPTPRATILAGKFLAVLFTLGVQASVLIGLSALVFQINWGQLTSLALVVGALTIAAAGFGVCLVAFIKNLRQSGPIIGGVITVTGMLGGLMSLGFKMPAAFEVVNLTMPQGWAMRGLRLVLDGAGPLEVLPSVLVLLAVGVALFAIGSQVFRRRFA